MQRVLFCLGGIALVLAAFIGVGAWFGPQVSNWLAQRIQGNANLPNDVEFPATAYVATNSSMEVTALGGQSRGLNCSIPSPVVWLAFRSKAGDVPVSSEYRQACVAHDYCYRHGAATYGYSQADCDLMLVRSSFRLCPKDRNETDDTGYTKNQGAATSDAYIRCTTQARKVYAGVFAQGASSFRTPSDQGIWPSSGSNVEFDPYPSGVARYAVPRLLRTEDGAALLFFLQRSGGGEIRQYNWTSGSFRFVAMTPVASAYGSLPAPPMVVRKPGRPGSDPGDMLLWWRRDAKGSSSTGGHFERGDLEPKGGVGIAKITAQGIDPGASQFFPVQGVSPDGATHLIAITEFAADESGWPGCTDQASSGIQIVHVAISANGHVACTVEPIKRIGATGNRRAEHVGSYLGIPPIVRFEAGGILVRLFRRDGEANPQEYTDLLSGLAIQIPLVDTHPVPPVVKRTCWALNESEEPFFPVSDDASQLASISFVEKGAFVDPDLNLGAKPYVRVASEETGDKACSRPKAGASILFPQKFKPFLQSRVIHVRIKKELNAEHILADNITVLVNFAVRKTPTGDVALDAQATVLGFIAGHLSRCESYDLGLLPFETEIKSGILALKKTSEKQAWLRAAETVPILGDVNHDGIPDLILADPNSGSSSAAYLGRADRDFLGFGADDFHHLAGFCPMTGALKNLIE